MRLAAYPPFSISSVLSPISGSVSLSFVSIIQRLIPLAREKVIVFTSNPCQWQVYAKQVEYYDIVQSTLPETNVTNEWSFQ